MASGSQAAPLTTSKGPSQRSWAKTSSRQTLKNYDKSPLASPAQSPPGSRKNSNTSVASTLSERPWPSERSSSEPNLSSTLKTRQETKASEPPSASSSKKSGLRGFLDRNKDPAKKERKKKEAELAAIQNARKLNEERRRRQFKINKIELVHDPEYQNFQRRHKKPKVKTANISTLDSSPLSRAAEQASRWPHSGKPSQYGSVQMPNLGKIESHDEADEELDRWQRLRKDWADAEEHKLGDIPELRSQPASRRPSPRASPLTSARASRDPSPNKLGVNRPTVGSKRNSWSGGYQRDPSGRWRKDSPTMTPVLPGKGDLNPDLLAKSLAERLKTSK